MLHAYTNKVAQSVFGITPQVSYLQQNSAIIVVFERAGNIYQQNLHGTVSLYTRRPLPARSHEVMADFENKKAAAKKGLRIS